MVHVRSSIVTEPPHNPLSRSHQFKGIRKRSWGRWVSEIRMPHSRDRIWLGSYSTPEQAARAYDVASVCLRGASASLNFPESPPPVVSGTFSRQDIQSLAAAAADVQTPAAHGTLMIEHHTHCSPGSVTDFQVKRYAASPPVISQEPNVTVEQAVFDDIFDEVEFFREIPSLSNFEETKFLQKRRDSCKSAVEADPYTCVDDTFSGICLRPEISFADCHGILLVIRSKRSPNLSSVLSDPFIGLTVNERANFPLLCTCGETYEEMI